MFPALDWFLAAVCLALLAALAWVTWLYLLTYRQLVQSNRDRDRLIGRIGQYHSLPLTLPAPDRLPDLHPDTPVPPAFRTRRPQPPPGWYPDTNPVPRKAR